MRLPALGGMWPGRAPRSSEPEQQQTPMAEASPPHDDVQPREPERARSHSTSSLGRQVFGLVRRERRGQGQEAGSGAEVESPKTPRFHLGMPMLPSTRLHLPHLTQTGTASRPPTSSAEHSRSTPEPRPSVPSPRSNHTANVILAPPRVVVEPAPDDGSRTSSSSGDTLTNEPREARARGAIVGDADETSNTEEEERPKRFLGCLPRIRSKRVRGQIIRCLISGLFLIFLLTICKSPSSPFRSPAWRG